MVAYYTAGKSPFLTIYGSPTDRTVVAIIPVAGKREARALAIKHNAQPYNF